MDGAVRLIRRATAVAVIAVAVVAAGAVAAGAVGAGCAGSNEPAQPAASASPAATVSPAATPAWSQVDDFLYQLQDIDLVKVGRTKFDLVITDYSENGHEKTRFTAEQIDALKHSPGGPELVLAYMSIGEAETYRWYWKKSWDANLDGKPDAGAPSWLGTRNPDWPDNYKVRFWDPR